MESELLEDALAYGEAALCDFEVYGQNAIAEAEETNDLIATIRQKLDSL
jgi:hypothetical protein